MERLIILRFIHHYMKLHHIFKGPVFGIDSKKHYRSWINFHGEKKEFRSMMSVVVNPPDINLFDDKYIEIMTELSKDFKAPPLDIRSVFKASEIGSLFPFDGKQFRSFCQEFAKRILDLKNIKISFIVTRINPKKLFKDPRTGLQGVIIYGQYGTPTITISIPEFIDTIEAYYNVIAAWKVAKITQVRDAIVLLDGTEAIGQCNAWNELNSKQHIRIIFRGDQIMPVVSTADIILRFLDFKILETKSALDENLLKKIIEDLNVEMENKYFIYVGNPEIDDIKPLSDRKLSLYDIRECIHHPIIFIDGGDLPGQRSSIESLPVYQKILSQAAGLGASVRCYNPKVDSPIIGKNKTEDYFVPLNDIAEARYQTLKRGGLNLKRLGPEGY